MTERHAMRPDVPEILDEQTISQVLSDMEEDILFNTKPILVRDMQGNSYFETFYQKHTTYLKTHPKVNALVYLTNLKTMIRIRVSK